MFSVLVYTIIFIGSSYKIYIIHYVIIFTYVCIYIFTCFLHI